MSVDLTLLNPDFADRIKEFVLEANYQGLVCDVESGFRSSSYQDGLYALGRTVKNVDGITAQKPLGNIVTNARGGHSYHNWGIAADVVFLNSNGSFTWDVPSAQWKSLADLGSQFGLSWGGVWTGSGAALSDVDHYERTNGLTIQEAISIGDIQKVWDEVSNRG